MIVGSGRPVGPNGPKYQAQAPTASRMNAAKNMSFHTAYGTNGAPSLLVSSWYSRSYVARLTTRPGIGHSLMPSLSTISRCSDTNAINVPGTTKTWTAKNRESVAPPMIGPPSISFTMAGPATGTRLAIDAPIPRPQYASWSKRNTCPVNAMPNVINSRNTPRIQVSSR